METTTDTVWYYRDSNGLTWGPFTDEELDEIDGVRTSWADYTWEAAA